MDRCSCSHTQLQHLQGGFGNICLGTSCDYVCLKHNRVTTVSPLRYKHLIRQLWSRVGISIEMYAAEIRNSRPAKSHRRPSGLSSTWWPKIWIECAFFGHRHSILGNVHPDDSEVILSRPRPILRKLADDDEYWSGKKSRVWT